MGSYWLFIVGRAISRNAKATVSQSDARISSLDGIRAISIALVLLGHLSGTTNYPLVQDPHLVSEYGHLGVTIFFIISGFLITTLLLREKEKTGEVDLRGFYIRRAVRIMPAFLCFIGALAVADWLGWVDLSVQNFLYCLTYTVNYEIDRPWLTGHLWSLSVEEQFYLLWPAVFVWLGKRRALTIAISIFLAAPLVRVGLHVLFPSSPYRDLEIFPAVADAIAAGCIVALLRPRLLSNPTYLRFGRPYLAFFLLPIAFVVIRFDGYSIVDILGTPLLLGGIALFVEILTRHDAGFSGRILNSAPFVYLGSLSYSLYLWQQPFLNRHSTHVISSFPTNLVLAVIVAICSYKLVELPLINLRRRLYARAKHAQTKLDP